MCSSPAQLFRDTNTRLLVPLLEEASKLEFGEKPAYGKLRFILEKILLENGLIPNSKYSFLQASAVRNNEDENISHNDFNSEDFNESEY